MPTIITRNNLKEIPEKHLSQHNEKMYRETREFSGKDKFLKVKEKILRGDIFKPPEDFEQSSVMVYDNKRKVDSVTKEGNLVFFSVYNGCFSTTSAETISALIDRDGYFHIVFSANYENVIDGYYSFTIEKISEDNEYTITYTKFQDKNSSWFFDIVASDKTLEKWNKEGVVNTIDYLLKE
jgi:hypothetical protein